MEALGKALSSSRSRYLGLCKLGGCRGDSVDGLLPECDRLEVISLDRHRQNIEVAHVVCKPVIGLDTVQVCSCDCTC
jgi:hypothetical protein